MSKIFLADDRDRSFNALTSIALIDTAIQSE